LRAPDRRPDDGRQDEGLGADLAAARYVVVSVVGIELQLPAILMPRQRSAAPILLRHTPEPSSG